MPHPERVPAPEPDLIELTRQVRGCFNRLRTFAELLHADLGLSASTRAVIEVLGAAGDRTVPQIARAKSVSRQHIQVQVNELAGMGLVASTPNPADRRSPLTHLTGAGREVLAVLQQREDVVWGQLAAALPGADLPAAAGTLSALNSVLDRFIEERKTQ